MQYLVHTSGEVINRRDRVYAIQATSKEEAQEFARNKFVEEFDIVNEKIYIKASKRTSRAICSYIFMMIPIILSFINWKVKHDTVSIQPDFLSCVYAVLLYVAFVVRFKGIQRTTDSVIDIIFAVLMVLLLSSFIKAMLVTKTLSILGLKEISINTNIIFPVAIVLSWLGLKLVSAVCMASIGILALFNVASLSTAMGSVWGPVYVLCAFIGIILYLSVEPALVEAFPNWKHSVGYGVNHVKNDFVEAEKSAKKLGVKAQNYKKKKDLHIEKKDKGV
nr:hypothetical protein [uncultured Sellimonas sp.]